MSTWFDRLRGRRRADPILKLTDRDAAANLLRDVLQSEPEVRVAVMHDPKRLIVQRLFRGEWWLAPEGWINGQIPEDLMPLADFDFIVLCELLNNGTNRIATRSQYFSTGAWYIRWNA